MGFRFILSVLYWLIIPSLAFAQPVSVSSSVAKKLRYTTTLPATCVAGEIHADSNATSGQQVYLCESTNNWVLQGDGGGGGGGDNITVNTTAATNANFLDNLYIDWAIDTAATPDDITSKFNYAETLAGNPAFLVDECAFMKDASGGGFICEGSTADTAEQLYRFPDVNGADTTTYFALTSQVDGTIALTTDTTGGYAASTSEGGGATSLEADGVDALTEIAQAIKTAANDTSPLVIGTAGGNGEIAKWNTDGTLTDSNVIIGTLTDTKFCTYTAAGTVINCTSDGGSGAPTTADYLVGTADGGLSAEIVVGTAPGGELGGTWGTPTVDDSLTVDSWTLSSPTFTTAITATNLIVDAHLATTESFNLPIYSAKLTGAFVVFTPPTADACTQGAQIDAGDGNWRLLFDPTTDECATWQFVLPDYWAAHSELKIFYTMTSATANEVDFEAAVMCVTPGDAADIGTAGFANVATASDTVPGTVGYLDSVSITITDDSCAAGDVMFVVISKDANDATLDDATGDTEVVGVVYEFTR